MKGKQRIVIAAVQMRIDFMMENIVFVKMDIMMMDLMSYVLNAQTNG